MNTRKRWLTVMAIGVAFVLAACQTTPQADLQHPEFGISLSAVTPSPTETWDRQGAVEIVGTGMGSRFITHNEPATLTIPDIGTAEAVLVQVAL